MSDMVTLTIDEQEIEVVQGTTVLQAALANEICIPNLCYVPGAKPVGACRICLVEVEHHGRMKMTASCTLEAKNGMVVHAHSENVERARKNLAELLLAEAPESQVIQKLAERLGVYETRYPERDNDCVVCGRCVAACADIAKTGAKGFIGRGEERHVGLPFYKEEYCQSCGECKERCPIDIVVESRRGDPCGVCGSELSKNEEIPELCESCILDE